MEILCNRLLSALFNGAYQGLLLTALMWLGMKLVRRTNAATRHAAWFATLIVVAALPVVHLLLPPAIGTPAPPPNTHATLDRSSVTPDNDLPRGGPEAARGHDAEAATPGTPDIHRVPLALELDRFEERAPQHVIPDGVSDGIFDRLGTASDIRSELAGPADPEAVPPGASPEPEIAPAATSDEPLSSFGLSSFTGLFQVASDWWLLLPDGAGPALIACWALLAAMRMGVLIRDLVRLNSFKRRAASAPEQLRAPFVVLTEEMGVRRPIRLLLCPESGTPMVVGFRNPAVLLPEKLPEGILTTQLQQILRHELAHVERRDDWANLIQQGIRAVLFFHPGVWWLCRRLTLEREVACDDHVLAASRTPRAYALFLTEFAGRMRSHRLAAAPAAWTNHSQLKERIAMILDSNRNASPRLAGGSAGLLTLTTALIAAGALITAPRLALAAAGGDQESQEPREVATEEEINVSSSVSVQVEAGIAEETALDEELPAAAASIQAGTSRIVSAGHSAGPAVITASGPRPKPAASLPESHTPPPATVTANLPPVPRISGAPPSPAVRLSALPAPVPVPVPEVVPEVAVNVHPLPAPSPHVVVAFAPDEDKEVPPPAGRGSKGPSDSSIERRLERLERLVEELLGRGKGPHAPDGKEFNLKFDHEFDKEKFAKLSEEIGKIAEKAGKAALTEAEMARIKDQVRKDVERAVRDVERANRDVDRAAREVAASKAQQRAQSAAAGQPLRTERLSLEAQRKALAQQLEAVERQLEQLDQAREKIQEEHDDFGQEVAPKPGTTGDSSGSGNTPKRKPSTR